ncbi:VIR protein [Plasmodium vivax]|uniref:VIR protein n=1 Tax=Plasmodium vivax TaxID=5855 RepID=A0A1G4EDH8_PLAVI|nr:VIR protein [Plasmodium vivax]
MDPANPHTKRIRLNVFYDYRPLISKLPAEKRNLEIIKNIDFINILSYPLIQNKNAIISWEHQYENNLKKLLLSKKDKIEKDDLSVYCKNINYLIDIIVQRIRMFKGNEQVKWEHDIEQTSKRVLRDSTWLKCERNFDNHKNRYVYVKKMMYDLCEDMNFIMENENILDDNRSSKFIKRIKYRKDTLMEIYKSFIDRKYFSFDNHCTISYIKDKFEELDFKHKAKQMEAIANKENTIIAQTQTFVQETQEDEITSDGVQATDAENHEELSVELDLNEDSHTEPKLDTTYAAASLAGISLFGTILYKYGPFRNRLNSRRGAINGSNIFPLDNNVYDANLMNNFEYLQTGIPNDEYQLGYGSVTDY